MVVDSSPLYPSFTIWNDKPVVIVQDFHFTRSTCGNENATSGITWNGRCWEPLSQYVALDQIADSLWMLFTGNCNGLAFLLNNSVVVSWDLNHNVWETIPLPPFYIRAQGLVLSCYGNYLVIGSYPDSYVYSLFDSFWYQFNTSNTAFPTIWNDTLVAYDEGTYSIIALDLISNNESKIEVPEGLATYESPQGAEHFVYYFGGTLVHVDKADPGVRYLKNGEWITWIYPLGNHIISSLNDWRR